MANDFTKVIPKLLAQGLLALRQQAIMPRLVNRDYETMAALKGATVDVPIPSAIAAQQVAPSNVPPATADVAPTSVPISLDQWWEAPFYMTDKDIQEAMEGTIPMQASEAIKSIANNVDNYILSLYTGIYGYTGTAGTTPFASNTVDYTNARTILNKQLAPLDDRRVVLNPDAEGNALNLQAFQYAQNAGDTNVIIKGQIGKKLGADWFMDQNIPTHASTALSAGAATVNGAHAAGVKTISIAKATNASNLVKGDIISFAGDPQTYTVAANVTLAVGNTNVTINPVPGSPGLALAKSGGEAMTLRASHVVNLNFHRDAFAFASRPLKDLETPGALIQSAVDPLSGLALRLEITREHKRTRFSFDILYGAALVRAELAARIAG